MKITIKNVLCSVLLSSSLMACGSDTDTQVDDDSVVSVDPITQQPPETRLTDDPIVLKDGRLVDTHLGFSALSDGQGGVNYEGVAITTETGFDKARSLEAFGETLYPYLKGLPNASPSGAAEPMHANDNMALAHEYALTMVYFNDTQKSKLVTDLSIYRKNCRNECAKDAAEMLSVINEWKTKIQDMLYQTPRTPALAESISDADIQAWIDSDKQLIETEEQEYYVYVSLNELHNNGVTADELNIVRTGLAKALNSVARWAPKVVNPKDVNGTGILYRFDIRDYWAWSKGVTKLLYGGSDDDMAFGSNKFDYLGESISASTQNEQYFYSKTIDKDSNLAKIIWQRVLHGNVEGAKLSGNLKSNIEGFKGERSSNNAGEFVRPSNLKWVEATQLIYTLTRPDVYAAIMMLPMYADQLEAELGIDTSAGVDSYDYFVTMDAPSVDAQLTLLTTKQGDQYPSESTLGAPLKTARPGFYLKTFEVFTGNYSGGDRSIFDIYEDAGEDIHFPFWANPIPKFIDPNYVLATSGSSTEDGDDFIQNWSFVATLAQIFAFNPQNIPSDCDHDLSFSVDLGFYNCRHFSGLAGQQQSGSTVVWDLPNGLNGYMRLGTKNQRRLEAFINVIRDPRLIPDASDEIATHTGFDFDRGNGRLSSASDPRFNSSSSMMSLYPDGMNRISNDLRDWLDNDLERLPRGPYGVDSWINEEETVSRVKTLYPSSDESREFIEGKRKVFLGNMASIRNEMVIGEDKNIYIEPITWAVEYAQKEMYPYPQISSDSSGDVQ